MKTPVKILAGVLFACLICFLIFPIGLPHDEPAYRTRDIVRMKQLSLALIFYASDHDERMPLPAAWADEALTYSKDNDATKCTRLPKDSRPDAHGHVVERSMPGRNLLNIKDPASTLMLFDGANLKPNAVDNLSEMRVTRSRGSHSFTVAFADGHVKSQRVEVVER